MIVGGLVPKVLGDPLEFNTGLELGCWLLVLYPSPLYCLVKRRYASPSPEGDLLFGGQRDDAFNPQRLDGCCGDCPCSLR